MNAKGHQGHLCAGQLESICNVTAVGQPVAAVPLPEQRLQAPPFDLGRDRLQHAEIAGVGIDQGLRRQHHGAPCQRLHGQRIRPRKGLLDQ
ncbi:hypothetical protein G6F59_018081 [Rhizopus arrhizus]|nr:hypothetical protein G6F59_018081 [Rhizopus arrhizus]